MTLYWIFILAAALTFLLTGVLLRYALRRNLLDIPNDRSSHTVPTPRGGGVAIVASFLGCLALLGSGREFVIFHIVVIMAGSLVALIGFWDDHGHIPARWRVLAHFVVAGFVMKWFGGLPILPILGVPIDFGWVGHLLATVYIVWLLNLYNFMDGIDGIASIEAITVCCGGALVYLLAVPRGSEWLMPILLLAAVSGFLLWNFPHAKIFMGDAGSGFLGLMMGVFSIHAAAAASELFWCWVILLGVFVVDATVTLLRRILRGEKFYEAHRSHAYQYATREYGAHWRVSLAVGMINLFWLLPFALSVAVGWVDGVVGVLLSYIPLIGLAFRYKAGADES